MTHDDLFLHDLEELDERLASHRSEGDVLKIAVILRRLLLDHPRGDPRTLIDAVNEGRNVNVQFLVDGTAQPSVQTSVFFMEADGLVPSIGPAIVLNMKTFLTHPIIMFQGQTCSVKDVILFAAHVEGAVHKGAPENARQHALATLSTSVTTPAGSPTVYSLLSIARVVLEALKPLRAQVSANWPGVRHSKVP
jgi:hypothetical protein